MSAAEETHHAEGTLEGMLEVMVKRIDSLIISVTSVEALFHPTKGSWDELSVSLWIHFEVARTHLLCHRRSIPRVYLGKHRCDFI
jgi:hypothetical protein